jgi:Beta-ketoacyl synthase, N-terminal domain
VLIPFVLVQVSIDTACSSAMVGTHMAAVHLIKRGGTALAAGINLMLAERTTAAAQVAGMLTADGRCKALDSAADGYVRAEACIVLCLNLVNSHWQGEGTLLALKGTDVNQVRIPSLLLGLIGWMHSYAEIFAAFLIAYMLQLPCKISPDLEHFLLLEPYL